MIAGAAPTPMAVAVVLLPAFVLMLAFALSYIGAFHEPTPHNVPMAVRRAAVGRDAARPAPGDPLDTRAAPSRADALAQIDDREVYGAYDVAANRLYVASAANRATAIALEQTMNRAAAAQGRPAVRVTDVKPLPPRTEWNGRVLRGDRMGVRRVHRVDADRSDRHPRSRSRARAAARIGALAAFGVVSGILSVIALRACFGVFAGHIVALCAIAALTIFASAAATAGIQAAAGPAGSTWSSGPRPRPPSVSSPGGSRHDVSLTHRSSRSSARSTA
jgi:hypothetical protein